MKRTWHVWKFTTKSCRRKTSITQTSTYGNTEIKKIQSIHLNETIEIWSSKQNTAKNCSMLFVLSKFKAKLKELSFW